MRRQISLNLGISGADRSRRSLFREEHRKAGGAMRAIGAAALFLALCACSQSRGMRPNDTQVVAQWLVNDDADTFLAVVTRGFRNVSTEQVIDGACNETCFDDGNDVGSGTFNVYLYTQDVSATVRLLVSLESAGRIPPGLRIGVAQYKDGQRRDWTYRAAYPAWLTSFDLIYRNAHER